MSTETTNYVDKVIDMITAIESKARLTINGFLPTRYPYTYGLDYIRTHGVEFGITDRRDMSRAEASGWLRDQVSSEEEKIEILVLLAAAYLRENQISTIACGWCKEALVRDHGLIWVTRTGEGHCPTPDSPNRAHKPQSILPRRQDDETLDSF